MLTVETIETPDLGDRSYLVHDGSTGLVVDPQRDVDRVLHAADRAGVAVSHVLETHVHNDYVSGGPALARECGAAYVVAAAEDLTVEREPVAVGARLHTGDLQVQVLGTPGHTPHHVAYAVGGPAGPAAVFTGGSLLFGTVGRTDLSGAALTERLTREQYRSARRLAATLPDAVTVHPTHGFGSFCSSTASAGGSTGTLGGERAVNPALLDDDEDHFVRVLMAGLTAYPRYYAHMGPLNRAGAAAPDLSAPEPLDPAALRGLLADGGWVVDLRERRAFAREHLAGTLSVEIGDAFTTYLGWVLPWGTPLSLLGDTAEDVARAQRSLARIGIDRLAGAAAGPLRAVGGDLPVTGYPVADFAGLAAARSAAGPDSGDPAVLDVRRDDEWAAGHLAAATHVPLPDLTERLAEVPSGTVWVHCASGFRAAIGASLLHRAGRSVVHVDDEWDRAAAAGLPVVAED